MHTHMADAPAVNDQQVLAFLAQAHKALSLREIAAAMGIRHSGRRALAKIIPRLARRGEIVEIRNGRYKLAEDRAAQQSKKEKEKSTRPDRSGSRDRSHPSAQPATAPGPVAPKASDQSPSSNLIEGR